MNRELGILSTLSTAERRVLILAATGLYLFFGFQYWLVLWFTSGGNRNAWKEALIDYFILKAILTIPVAWLFFRRLGSQPVQVKIAIHLITGTAWVTCWFYLYRLIQDFRGGYYLQGNASWWDVYIPGLFYCIQFAMFHLFEFYLSSRKEKELQFQLAETAMRTEIRLLKSQMQPHFLFNSLNSISASVPPSLESTREMIARLADIFRYSLNASKSDFVELQQEINFTRDFLSLEQNRYGERLKVHYDIDEQLFSVLIPPMLIQPLVENSIKHGIAKSLKGGEISICIKKIENRISVQIIDTGIGYPDTSKKEAEIHGLGLQNTRKRLWLLFKEELRVQSVKPHGTHVHFNLPVKLNHD